MLHSPPAAAKQVERKTLSDWLLWLDRCNPEIRINLGLERVTAVAGRLLDSRRLAGCVVAIAGTNGKGSTVAVLESIAAEAGLTTGSVTSPHLLRFNERVRINGQPVNDAMLCSAFNQVEQKRIEAAVEITYFEYSTLVAFSVFLAQMPDVVFLEVGMGGRLDAVNCIDADIAVVTTVSLDHRLYLGDTVAAIAKEKAGIYKPGKIAVAGDGQQAAFMAGLIDKNRAIPVLRGQDFDLTCEPPLYRLRFTGLCNNQTSGLSVDETVRLSHEPGFSHKVDIGLSQTHLPLTSVACAVQTVLTKPFPVVSGEAIKRGVQKAQLAGRMQLMALPPARGGQGGGLRETTPGVMVLLDVAHNVQAIEHLTAQIKRFGLNQRKITLVIGMLSDKDHYGIVSALQTVVSDWFITAPDTERALPLEEFKKILEDGRLTYNAHDSTGSAFQAALASVKSGGLIVVAGSFFAVSEVMPLLDSLGAETIPMQEVPGCSDILW